VSDTERGAWTKAKHRDGHGYYVKSGYCESVHWTKVYCGGRAGHAGWHHAYGLQMPELRWPDEQARECECTS
jgi:hypothetical protein